MTEAVNHQGEKKPTQASGGLGSSGTPSTRKPRVRRGLGKGLGALIPDAEPERVAAAERPLDLLFPDLTTQGSTTRSGDGPSESASGIPRGGSARDLLSPRQSKNVSRETFRTRQRSTVSAGDNVVARRTNAEEAGTLQVDLNEVGDTDSSLTPVPGASFAEVPPSWIIPNLKQPRQVFDEAELRSLAASISEVGVLQPIVVRRITTESLGEPGQEDRLKELLLDQPDAQYELVMGERRWRAAQLAHQDLVPVIVRSTGEDDLLREALIENIHRVQLNPLEEAAAYSQLMQDFGYTQEQVAEKVAKSRPQVANTLRLMKLPPVAQRMLAADVISAGHARALLGLKTLGEMEALAERIAAEGLSVRGTEEIVKFGKAGLVPRKPLRIRHEPTVEAQRIADIFAARLDTTVTVATGAKKGKLTIEFADQADLDRIFLALGLSDQ